MKLWRSIIGTGPHTAALIPGVTGDGGTWFEFAPWLAEHGYTVGLVDLRGHGHSPRADSYSSEELADDLVDTLPTGLDLIIAHSLGGRALALAVDRLRPARAIYLDPAWVVGGHSKVLRPVHEDGTLMTVDELSALMPSRSRAHIEQAICSNALSAPKVLEAPNYPLFSYKPTGAPVVPSLVVTADPSALVPPSLARQLRADGYTVRVVPNGQHDLHVLSLEATQRAIEDWL